MMRRKISEFISYTNIPKMEKRSDISIKTIAKIKNKISPSCEDQKQRTISHTINMPLKDIIKLE